MYSDRLKEIKGSAGSDGAMYCSGLSKEQLYKMIVGFCSADDVIGVPHKELFSLFDEYCAENGYPIVNRMTLGRAFCQVFGVRTVKGYVNKKICNVYSKY